MNFQKRLMVFFMSYIWFTIFFFFWANFLFLIIPVLGLVYLVFGGRIHVRPLD